MDPNTDVADQQKRGKPSWAWPTAWMISVLAVLLAGVYIIKSCRDVPGEIVEKSQKVIHDAGQQLAAVAAAFNQGTVTTTFTSYATTLSGSQYLQFATLKQHEKFTRTDESTTGFGYIPLPEIVVEAEAPVTYTYYLDLTDRWEFQLRDGVIWVTAPDIKFNPPAVDASQIKYQVTKDSMLRKSGAAMENLKSSITGLSHERAKTNIDLVRETGRAKTESFVETWVARSFSDGKNYAVKVRFRSEVPSRDVMPPAKRD
jgi:hypothetical protein